MSRLARFLALALAPAAIAAPAWARTAQDIAGPWQLSLEGTSASCRVVLEGARSDAGDFFLAIPPACRHAMPGIASAGRWAASDGHLAFVAPGGAVVLTLAAAGAGYAGTSPTGTFTLMPVLAAPRTADAAASPPPAVAVANAAVPAAAPAAAPPKPSATPRLQPVSTRRPPPSAADLAGRYAVMRGKHDTGCMLTLDQAHAKGGDRAQLAPGCRDQGIVVFDPTSWQVMRGTLVLTARAGHQARLERGEGDTWEKDAKEGGKPLGLKKL